MTPIPLPIIDEQRIVALIKSPRTLSRSWIRRAACAGMAGGLETYFPDNGSPSLEAMACCLSCPVAHECLATALVYEATDEYRNGWWGGLGPDERDLLASRLGLRCEPAPHEPADLARRLRAQNYSIPAIAAELGCTERTVYRYLAKKAA